MTNTKSESVKQVDSDPLDDLFSEALAITEQAVSEDIEPERIRLNEAQKDYKDICNLARDFQDQRDALKVELKKWKDVAGKLAHSAKGYKSYLESCFHNYSESTGTNVEESDPDFQILKDIQSVVGEYDKLASEGKLNADQAIMKINGQVVGEINYKIEIEGK